MHSEFASVGSTARPMWSSRKAPCWN